MFATGKRVLLTGREEPCESLGRAHKIRAHAAVVYVTLACWPSCLRAPRACLDYAADPALALSWSIPTCVLSPSRVSPTQTLSFCLNPPCPSMRVVASSGFQNVTAKLKDPELTQKVASTASWGWGAISTQAGSLWNKAAETVGIADGCVALFRRAVRCLFSSASQINLGQRFRRNRFGSEVV